MYLSQNIAKPDLPGRDACGQPQAPRGVDGDNIIGRTMTDEKEKHEGQTIIKRSIMCDTEKNVKKLKFELF